MKLLFKQKFFSWFDSYNVFNENNDVVFTVQGKLAWGHKLVIYDAGDREIAMVREEIITLLPRFKFYLDGDYAGELVKELTLFKPRFNLNFKDWEIKGDIFEWDYSIVNSSGREVAVISKELFNFTDTYSVEVENEADALPALMVVMAIDAEKCSRND